MALLLRNAIPRLWRKLSGRASHSAEVGDVIEVAQALETGEYGIFRMAYARFYGRTAGALAVIPDFLRYLVHQVVPPFVRHFTHSVLESRRRGQLNRGALDLGRRVRVAALPPEGDGTLLAVLAASAVTAAVIALAKALAAS